MTRSRRTLRFESLSSRALLAADLAGIADAALVPTEAAEFIVDPTTGSNAPDVASIASATNTNPAGAHDVNADGQVDRLDTSMLIETLELRGAYQLPESESESRVYLDVNGDGWIAPSDVLQVVNEIDLRNTEVADADVQIRLEVGDAGGTPLDTLRVGDDFLLHVFVRDNRAQPQGVFAAYTDITFSPSLVTANPFIQHGSAFRNALSGRVSMAGAIEEFGGVGSVSPVGSVEQLLGSIPFRATGSGQVRLSSNPADVLPAHAVLLHGEDSIISVDRILYGSTFFLIESEEF